MWYGDADCAKNSHVVFKASLKLILRDRNSIALKQQVPLVILVAIEQLTFSCLIYCLHLSVFVFSNNRTLKLIMRPKHLVSYAYIFL